MGNAASSGVDPATVGMEAYLERLRVRPTGIVADAMTKEDHAIKAPARRQKSSDSIKYKKTSDPARIAIDEDMGILQLGFDKEEEEEVVVAGNRYRRHRNEAPAPTEAEGRSGKARTNKKKDKGTNSMGKHMKEMEDFVTAVRNDKNAKKQLRASLVIEVQ
jgi:hypothetical protein